MDGGAGNDLLSGGLGVDEVSYLSSRQGVSVNLATTTAQNTVGAGMDTLRSIEGLFGSNYDDHLTGNDLDNTLIGGPGGDTLIGGKGNDSLQGWGGKWGEGLGCNLLDGGEGDDRLISGDRSDTLLGGAGNDLLIDEGASQLSGGSGNDTLQSGNFCGSGLLDGGEGDDQLVSDMDDDILRGGDGNDLLNGGDKWDLDWADYSTSLRGVSVNLSLTTPQNTLGAGTDTLLAIEGLLGSDFNDQLTGDAMQNHLDGGAGADTLIGGAGNDILVGGLGKDRLSGGTGADHFDFDASIESGQTSRDWDVITDFSHAEHDLIDLSTIDANPAIAGNQAFTFIDSQAFSSTDASGQLRYEVWPGVLYGSTDADSDPEFAIELTGLSMLLVASDLAL